MEILQENAEESAKTLQQEIEAALIEPEPEVTAAENAADTSDNLTRDEFESRFIELFDMAEHLTEIKGLKIDREKAFELAGAKKTAEKLYDCAEKYKVMHFLIENRGGWLGDAILIGGFCYSKANIVVAHYSGQTLGARIMARFRRLPASVQQKTSVFGKFFKKEVNNESQAAAA